MLFKTKMEIAALILLSAVITGCAGTLGSIKEENRDTTGIYDGIWKVDVLKAAGIQYVGKWNMHCGDMRTSFNLRVDDGTILFGNAENTTKAYVSAEGAFKLTHPLSGKASASGASSITMANGSRKLILTGRLVPDGGNSKGFITYGIAEVGYGGCTAKTKYSFTSPANKSSQT